MQDIAHAKFVVLPNKVLTSIVVWAPRNLIHDYRFLANPVAESVRCLRVELLVSKWLVFGGPIGMVALVTVPNDLRALTPNSRVAPAPATAAGHGAAGHGAAGHGRQR